MFKFLNIYHTGIESPFSPGCPLIPWGPGGPINPFGPGGPFNPKILYN